METRSTTAFYKFICSCNVQFQTKNALRKFFRWSISVFPDTISKIQQFACEAELEFLWNDFARIPTLYFGSYASFKYYILASTSYLRKSNLSHLRAVKI